MLEKILGNKKLLADVILISSLLLVILSVFLITAFTKEDGAVARVSGRLVDCARFNRQSR